MVIHLFAVIVALATPEPGVLSSLLGDWQCATAAQSRVTMHFSQAANGSIHLAQSWVNDRQRGAFEQSFDRNADGTWRVVQQSADNALRFVGASLGNVGSEIAFTGTLTVAPGPSSIAPPRTYTERETFRLLPDGRLEHVWDLGQRDGSWRPVSYASCTTSRQ